MIPQQIENLQGDEEFRAQCQVYYEKGYKDWVITMAVWNCMVQWQAERLGIDVRHPKRLISLENARKKLNNTTYPTWLFMEEDLARHMTMHSLVVLESYGFELRRRQFKPEVLEGFLRERMKHFELDLPHKPLFGEPPGNWPDV